MNATDQQKVVQKNLQVLGIEPETTRLYIELLKLGPSSALQLSKVTGVSRTQTYRHIEELQQHSLISAEQLSYGTLFRALPLENIESLIASREAETATVKRNLGAMSKVLESIAGSTQPQASTYHYYGRGGLKQVNWNLTKASKEFRVFETKHLSEHFDKAFARRCREQYIDRELISYDLTNAESVHAKDIEPFEVSRAFFRHIDPEILRINFEMYIYNDVVTLIDYSPTEPHATETHHAALAAMMRQLFNAMWNIAEPLEIR
jgi:sugar-specific transcriptional regulator TrmB